MVGWFCWKIQMECGILPYQIKSLWKSNQWTIDYKIFYSPIFQSVVWWKRYDTLWNVSYENLSVFSMYVEMILILKYYNWVYRLVIVDIFMVTFLGINKSWDFFHTFGNFPSSNALWVSPSMSSLRIVLFLVWHPSVYSWPNLTDSHLCSFFNVISKSSLNVSWTKYGRPTARNGGKCVIIVFMYPFDFYCFLFFHL